MLALAGTVCAPAPVTVTYGALAEGTVLPEAENVTFLQDPSIVDDYQQKMMMPPPGEGPGGPGGPGMPPPPPMG